MLLQIAIGNALFAICDTFVYDMFQRQGGFRTTAEMCFGSAWANSSHIVVILLEVLYTTCILGFLLHKKDFSVRTEVAVTVLIWLIGCADLIW